MQITIIFMKTSRMSHHGSAENGGYNNVLIQNLWKVSGLKINWDCFLPCIVD